MMLLHYYSCLIYRESPHSHQSKTGTNRRDYSTKRQRHSSSEQSNTHTHTLTHTHTTRDRTDHTQGQARRWAGESCSVQWIRSGHSHRFLLNFLFFSHLSFSPFSVSHCLVLCFFFFQIRLFCEYEI